MMKYNTKKPHLFLSIATLFFLKGATAFANPAQPPLENAQLRNLENRLSALEQRRGMNGMINPSARPEVKEGADLFVIADLLVWQAHEEGLAVGIRTFDNQPLPVNQTLLHAKVKNLDFNVNAGVRLGIGYNLPHDGWDLILTWLHFGTTAHRSAHSGNVRAIFPRFTLPNATTALSNPCQKLHSHWKMHLNQLDLDMGREFFVSKWLTLRPHFGLRTDWIDQKLKVNYKGFPSIDGTAQSGKWKDEWWGFGLEAGLDTQWGLGCGWSLYGNLGAAILYGFHDISQAAKNKPDPTHDSVNNSHHISHPILDLQLGIRWDHMFCNDRFHLALQTGWEHHIYFSQNQFMFFPSEPLFTNPPGVFFANQGDLTMQGWMLSVRFDF